MADTLVELLSEAKDLARRYYAHTGRPLGITGEVAEFEAVSILKLELAAVREPGFDATRPGSRGRERIQIKGRMLGDSALRSGGWARST